MTKPKKVLFFANTDWYLYNFRVPLAKYLMQNGYDVVMISPAGDFGERISRDGIRWIPVPMIRRSFSPITELRLIFALVRIYKAEEPDISHHFTIKCIVYGTLAAKIAGLSATINAVTGLGHVFLDSRLRSKIIRPVVKYLVAVCATGRRSRLILQNPHDAALFTRMRFVSNSRVTVIPGSGVNTNVFAWADRTNRSPPTQILMASRLLREKGVYEYIDAIRQIKNMDLDCIFLLAGSPDPGNPSSLSAEEVLEWQTEGLITYLGHVDDMPALLESVDVFVLPSYGEGLPRSLIEAAATGLPLISTDVPGCRDVVHHGANGLLVPPKDASQLADTFAYLTRDSDIRIRMGKTGREKVLQEFDEVLVFERTREVYQELVGRS